MMQNTAANQMPSFYRVTLTKQFTLQTENVKNIKLAGCQKLFHCVNLYTLLCKQNDMTLYGATVQQVTIKQL